MFLFCSVLQGCRLLAELAKGIAHDPARRSALARSSRIGQQFFHLGLVVSTATIVSRVPCHNAAATLYHYQRFPNGPVVSWSIWIVEVLVHSVLVVLLEYVFTNGDRHE